MSAFSPLRPSSRRCATPKRCCSSTTAEGQVAELDAFLEQGVGADGDGDGAVGEAGEHAAALGALHAAGQQGALHPGGAAQPGQGAKMLAGQDFRGRHDGGLRPGLHRLEHGQHGDQRLAGADIALQQAQHAVGRGEVCLDLAQGLGLGGGGGVSEGGERLGA
jgi:hypothetical protein